MQDIHDETPGSILLEYARFLKDAAKRCEEEINCIKRELRDIENRLLTMEVSNKAGFTIAEKILAFIAFLTATGISIIALIK